MKATKTKGRMCDDKRRHTTRDSAIAQMFRLIRAGASAEGMNVYRCPHCRIDGARGWHVGHKPGVARSR